jgi:hypothetical protein
VPRRREDECSRDITPTNLLTSELPTFLTLRPYATNVRCDASNGTIRGIEAYESRRSPRVTMHSSVITNSVLLFLAHIGIVFAQSGDKLMSPPPLSPSAFVDVKVVPMNAESVLSGQTVVIQQGRITAIGPFSSTPVPSGATVIQGHGRYLMPGLADMHVHLEGREDFGDAPLFLAYGITTVMNLRGRP